VLPNLGHADDFWAYEPAASTRLIDTFLEHGQVDSSLYTTHPLDFTPSFTHGQVAEIVLAVFLGFATLTVLSLLWIARRLRRRTTFGSKGSIAARSLLAIVLGFGGWCLGALIALTLLPAVPPISAAVAVLSIAPPVALAVFAGWFRSGSLSYIAGFATLAAATVGAWLGFYVPHAPGMGAITAIIGATLAANLGLIVLDVARPKAVDARELSSRHLETVAGAV
jgi:hypothetical protein